MSVLNVIKFWFRARVEPFFPCSWNIGWLEGSSLRIRIARRHLVSPSDDQPKMSIPFEWKIWLLSLQFVAFFECCPVQKSSKIFLNLWSYRSYRSYRSSRCHHNYKLSQHNYIHFVMIWRFLNLQCQQIRFYDFYKTLPFSFLCFV